MKRNDIRPIETGIKTKLVRYSPFILVAFLSFVFFFLTEVPNIYAVSDDPLILGAHRGDSILYMENTFESIVSALEDPNYHFIEFDIQYTKDKVLVVFHDSSLTRLQSSN